MPRKARSKSLSSTSPATLPNSIPTNRYGTMPKLGWRSGLSRLKRSSKRHCSRSYCLFSVQPDSYSHSSNSQRLSTPQVRSSADTCATVDSETVPILEKYPEVGLVYGDVALMNAQGQVTVERSSAKWREDHRGNELVERR